MLGMLSDYLNAATTHEEKIKIEHAHAIFERMELENYELGFEEILHLEDEVDAGGTVMAIIDLTRFLLHQMLHDHSVFMSESTDMEMLTNLCAGLLDLEAHEDKDGFFAAISADATLKETFCELMMMVTKYTVEDILPHVENVPEGILQKIIGLNDHDDDEEEDESAVVDRQTKIRHFRQYDIALPDGAPPRIAEMIRHGVDVGMPFTTYAGVIGADFEQMDPVQIAEEMFGIALISSDGADHPTELIKNHIEQYLANADTIVAVMAGVAKLATGFKS